MEKQKIDPRKQIADATLKDDKGRVRGYLGIGPGGQLVTLPPGSIGLAASVEDGVRITGLKDGWRLGTQAYVSRKQAENAARAKAEAKLADSGAAVADEEATKAELEKAAKVDKK